MLFCAGLFVLIAQCYGGFVEQPVDAFFKTNLHEMHDVEVKFEKPLPTWLKGTLIRNGLGRFEVGNRKFVNALDAFGKLASWKFPGNGSAYFSTRMIYSKSYNESLSSNEIAPYLMLDSVEPAFGIFEELESFRNGPDNMNVNIFNFGNEQDHDFTVVSDYWNVYTVDPYSLVTIDGIHPPIPNATAFNSAITLGSAHPLPEYGTNDHLSFVSVAPPFPEMPGRITLMRIKNAHEREVIANIVVDKVSYMHSFAVTENYVVLFAVPFYVNPIGMVKDFKPLDAFQWVPTDVTTLHIINLKTGAVRTMKTENMFFLHVVNAYESNLFNDEIIVDICTFRNTSGMSDMAMAKLLNPDDRVNSPHATLKRYTIDLTNNDVNVFTYEPSAPTPVNVNWLDFPTINEKYRSQKYCFTYGVVYNYNGKDMLDMALVKKDVCTGKGDKSWTSSGKYFNEAFFVPFPDGTEEDDGILVLPIHDSMTQTTNITMFDAKTMSIVNTAILPTNIPFGTHGHFFDYIY